MSRYPARRAVVTGLGAISPIGNDVATYWSKLT
jgi:3-oxoacyl-(acyl-carrier-protein) synthase